MPNPNGSAPNGSSSRGSGAGGSGPRGSGRSGSGRSGKAGGGNGGATGGARRGGSNRNGAKGSAQGAGAKGSGSGQQRSGAKAGTRPAKQVVAAAPGVDTPRVVAHAALNAVSERDAYINLVLPGLIRDNGLQGRDAAFTTELAYGTARASGQLDAIIAAAADRPLDKIDPRLHDTLRLGAYQLLRTRVDDHAAVDTTVNLAKAVVGGGAAAKGAGGFVNAVLRTISRTSYADWVIKLAPTDVVGYLAFEYAHPRWIADAFKSALQINGIDSAGELQALLAADDERPAVHLAARPGEISSEELAAAVGGEPGTYSPYAVHLDGGDPGELGPVRDGLARVQDEGSQVVAVLTANIPTLGEDSGRWLDLCAGPGGKAAMLGSLAQVDGARVDAVEPTPHRAELVRKAVSGLPVTVHTVDGRVSGLEAGYDRILIDAPCSGIGSLRRRPESRWRRHPEDIAALATLQRELLSAAAGLIRPGGVIVYATCSPHPSETVDVLAELVDTLGLERLNTPALVGPAGEGQVGPHVQLWPHRQGTDAMFMQALRAPLPLEASA